jgi:carboxylate-amine ligase
MTASRAISDPSYIWWAIRPSLKHPTLELRVADSCTSVADALGIAALYRALARHLDMNPLVNGAMTASSRAVALENKWRAQRYGIHGSFIDEGTQTLKNVADVFDEVIDMIDADIRELGVRDEIVALRTVFQRGTSADTQIALHTEALGRGRGNTEALADVIDWLASTTRGAESLVAQPELVH